MKRAKLYLVLLVGVYFLTSCIPSVQNTCLDAYYETLENTESRDDAAQVYLLCIGDDNNG